MSTAYTLHWFVHICFGFSFQEIARLSDEIGEHVSWQVCWHQYATCPSSGDASTNTISRLTLQNRSECRAIHKKASLEVSLPFIQEAERVTVLIDVRQKWYVAVNGKIDTCKYNFMYPQFYGSPIL